MPVWRDTCNRRGDRRVHAQFVFIGVGWWDNAAMKPSVLFACVHNAGRSQMAAGFMRHLSDGAVDVFSGGSNPGDQVNPSAVAAMAEIGIDISEAVPQKWSNEEVEAADVVVTMGCGDE